jgi:hypothetical protein
VSRLRCEESGANAVEFALVLPILLILLFGTITGGMLYNQQLALTQAAREGARFAATLPGATDGTCSQAAFGDDSTWCGRVRDRTLAASTSPIEGLIVSFEEGDGAGEAGEVRVTVSAPGRLEIIFASWTPTVSATSVARYEG